MTPVPASIDGVWALVPVKRLGAGKQRLRTALDTQAAREQLILAMLEDVLRSISASIGPARLGGCAVVTDDARAASIGRRHGADIVSDAGAWVAPGGAPCPSSMPDDADGYSRAVANAIALLARCGACAALVLPADLPLITPMEIERLVAAHRDGRRCAIVAARDGRGTNAVLLRLPASIALAFDGASFGPHLDAARLAGLDPLVLQLPGIAFDIDLPRDLGALAEHPQARGTMAGRLARRLAAATSTGTGPTR
ncbi:MAG: NTP transferase domain-containing protein [Lautropia sp.]